MPRQLYTIGHGNITFDAFLALLTAQQIELLVDVRSAPYSRYVPHFNQNALQHALSAAQIKYSFAGAQLGGRPTDPTCYRDGQVPDPKMERAKYLKLVDYAEVAKRPFYLAGIERLLSLSDQFRTVVMCSEENPDHCHRSALIQKTLLERGVAVFHIRQSGDVTQAGLTASTEELKDALDQVDGRLTQPLLF